MEFKPERFLQSNKGDGPGVIDVKGLIFVRNLSGFDPIHKPWPMDHPHEISEK